MGLSRIVSALLERRGITAAELEGFLHPSLDKLTAPEELPGIVEAAEVILAALAAKKSVVVFGDYDCDGICATAILVRTLRALGGRATEFVPNRLSEGYGMSEASVARLLGECPDVGLVITVDNGINSVSQVAEMKARGIGVVVTDHHLPGEELPAADALVNPKVAAPPTLENLCGAGVAFLLANRLVSEAKRRGFYAGPPVGAPLLVMAGLATVTDVMPLKGQNRILVAEALRRFLTSAPIGLRELHARAARTGADALTAKDFGFLLGPRINAAGRMASGLEALELLLSDDREISRELARIIDGYNVERKAIEQKMVDEVMAQIVPDAPAQVIDLPHGHPGVAGIVAARVMEKLGNTVPVCVQASGRGSGRAPQGFNIRDAFVACAEVLDRFGGHAAAGGFSVKPGRMDDFRRMLCDYALAVRGADASAVSANEPDLWIEPDEVTLELAEELKLLEPFGEGNAEPRFGLRGVRLLEVRTLGADGRHLAVSLFAPSSVAGRSMRLRAVWWGHGDELERLRALAARSCDIVFALSISNYGERHVELSLSDVLTLSRDQK